MQQAVPERFGQFLPGAVQRHRVMAGKPLNQALIIGLHLFTAESAIRLDGTSRQRLGFIGNHQFGIENQFLSQAMTNRAGPMG